MQLMFLSCCFGTSSLKYIQHKQPYIWKLEHHLQFGVLILHLSASNNVLAVEVADMLPD